MEIKPELLGSRSPALSGLLSSQVDEPVTPVQYDTSITGIAGSRALMHTPTPDVKGM